MTYYVKKQNKSVRIKPATGEIYHIFNRGVEKRNIFREGIDYTRFIHNLFEFNDMNPAGKWYISQTTKQQSKSNHISEVQLPKYMKEAHTRKILVEIFSFCLMPNHYHLMLRQVSENGISEFIRKIGTGYTHYFNQKYQREGSLFQGKYKYMHITDNTHFMHLPYYIHLNPLDLFEKNWRDGILQSKKEALRFLESYRWSSYLDYIDIKNFPSVTQRTFLTDILESPEIQKQHMLDWIQRYGPENIEHITLE
jgi:putative transposase